MGDLMPQQPETFEQAIAELNAKVTDAFNRGDVKACAESYAEDAIMFLADRPPIRGRSAIATALQEYATSGAKLAPVEPLEIRSSGDIGVCAGTYRFEFPPSGGVPKQARGKFVTVFTRQMDGSWKAAIDALIGDAA